MKKRRESSLSLFRRLPALFKVSWLLIGFGVLGMSAGYALRLDGPGWIGITLFLAGYPLGLWPILRSRPSGEAGGLYVTGLVMSTVTATFFLVIQLVIAALLAGVLLMIGRFHSEGAVRILHFIGLLTAATVMLSIPRAVRIVSEQQP